MASWIEAIEAKARIIHQSSATGMQAIPSTGIAQGIQYWEKQMSFVSLLIADIFDKYK